MKLTFTERFQTNIKFKTIENEGIRETNTKKLTHMKKLGYSYFQTNKYTWNENKA